MNKTKRAWLTVVFLLFMCKSAYGQEIWKVLLAEAADQGYLGLKAVACVMRNRGGSLQGFSGAKRKNLDAFCQRQGAYWISIAKQVEREVFSENCPDITKGSTHFESIDFPKPKWAYSMKESVTIGKHIFYKE